MMIRKALLRSGRVDWLRLLLLAGTILLPACSNSLEDHPPLYPVKGKVILDGKPMTSGTIIFEYSGDGADAPKGAGGGPFRVTAKIKDGAFNLIGYAGSEGMPAGNYKVGISATQGRSEDQSLRPGSRASEEGEIGRLGESVRRSENLGADLSSL